MVKSKTSTWYTVTVKMDKMMPDGMLKKVKEDYVVESFSPSEAQETITQYLQDEIVGEFSVKTCKEEVFKEYLQSSVFGDYWFRAKVSMLSLDENSGKEKRMNIPYLINADNLKEAAGCLTSFFEDSISDYEVISITKTSIVDIIQKWT